MSYYCITVCSQRYDGVEEQNWLGHKVPKMHAPFFRVSQGDESPHSQQPWLLDQSHLQAFWCLQNFLEGTHTPRRDIFSSNALPSHLQAGMRQVSYMTVWSKSGQPGHRSYFFENLFFGQSVQNKGRKHQLQTSNLPQLPALEMYVTLHLPSLGTQIPENFSSDLNDPSRLLLPGSPLGP